MLPALDVTTVGAATSVVNESTLPSEVPCAFVAIEQYQYVTPALSPVMTSVYEVVVLPDSAVPPVAGARTPVELLQLPGLLVYQRKKAVVAAPFAFASALSVAPLDVTLVAEM